MATSTVIATRTVYTGTGTSTVQVISLSVFALLYDRVPVRTHYCCTVRNRCTVLSVPVRTGTRTVGDCRLPVLVLSTEYGTVPVPTVCTVVLQY